MKDAMSLRRLLMTASLPLLLHAPSVSAQRQEPPAPVASQRSSAGQQQVDAQLDRGLIEKCFGSLGAVVSRYEHLANPGDDQTIESVTALGTAYDHCGLIEGVRADPRYAAFTRRANPLLTRAVAIEKRRCEARRARDTARAAQARQNNARVHQSTCWQTCRGNGFEDEECLKRCDTSGAYHGLFEVLVTSDPAACP